MYRDKFKQLLSYFNYDSMKKHYPLFSITASLVLLFSCSKTGDSFSNADYVYLLTSMESLGADNTRLSIEYNYSDHYSSPITESNMSLYFKEFVVLREQTITGDTLSHIQYVYTGGNVTIITTKTDSGTDHVVLKRDNNGMASSVSSGNADDTSSPIGYDEKAYRTNVHRYRMISEDGLYVRADTLSSEKTRYYYSNLENKMSIQQFGMYGSQYHWPTGLFGRQSRLLLDKIVRTERGEKALYEYNYVMDNNGFVVKETIIRNGILFITNRYTYKMGVIMPTM